MPGVVPDEGLHAPGNKIAGSCNLLAGCKRN